jgi:ABC-type sugar transport system substrate-binding protein
MKNVSLYLFLFCQITFFNACQTEQQEKQFTIGFSQCCNDPWRDMMEQEIRMELSFHPEIAFEMAVGNNSSETQVEQIKALVHKGIDLLIVAPNETEPLTAVVE